MKKIYVVLVFLTIIGVSCSSSKSTGNMTNIPQATDTRTPSKTLDTNNPLDNDLKNKKLNNNSATQAQKKPALAKEYKVPPAISDSI